MSSWIRAVASLRVGSARSGGREQALTWNRPGGQRHRLLVDGGAQLLLELDERRHRRIGRQAAGDLEDLPYGLVALPLIGRERRGDHGARGLSAAARPGHTGDLRDHLPPGGLSAGADVHRAPKATERRHRQGGGGAGRQIGEHTSELQSRRDLVCRLLLEKKKKNKIPSFVCKKNKTKNKK